MEHQVIKLNSLVLNVSFVKYVGYIGCGALFVGVIGKTVVHFYLRRQESQPAAQSTSTGPTAHQVDAVLTAATPSQSSNSIRRGSMPSGTAPLPPSEEDSPTYMNTEQLSVNQLTEKQAEWIEELKDNSSFKFSSLQNADFPMVAAKDGVNSSKSRYVGLYPYDTNRVKILTGADGSDYVNMSPIDIDGYKMVAAQGPKDITRADFWSGCWRENVRLITMVTGFVEDGKNKCSKYLPLTSKSFVFDESIKSLTLQFESETETIDLIDRKIPNGQGELMLNNGMITVFRNRKYYSITKLDSKPVIAFEGGLLVQIPDSFTQNIDGYWTVQKDDLTFLIYPSGTVAVIENEVTAYGIISRHINGFAIIKCSVDKEKKTYTIPNWTVNVLVQVKGQVKTCFFSRDLENDENDDAYEQFEIKCTAVEIEDSFTLTTLEVTRSSNGKSDVKREFKHLHFTAWPDHGVPEEGNLKKFRNFFLKFLKLMLTNGPGIGTNVFKTLIHCSAGVGRTGTLFAFLLLLLRIEKREFDETRLWQIINEELRSQRPTMVQSEEQYEFILEKLTDFAKDWDIMEAIRGLIQIQKSSEINSMI